MESLLMCTDSTPQVLGLFDFTIAPPFLFYSYIPIGLIALLLGLFVLFNNRSSLSSKFLFGITLTFVIYISVEILLWISIPAALVYFGWSLLILLRIVMVALTVMFAYSFIYKKIPSYLVPTLAVLVTPLILMTPTSLNVTGFDIDACEAINGVLWFYLYFLEILAFLLFLTWGVKKLYAFKNGNQLEFQNALLLFGSMFLVTIFSTSTILGNYTLVYETNLIGPLGMLIFIFVLTYLIVQFKAFNIKLVAAQALVIGLIFLVGSLLFVAQSIQTRVVAAFTLVLVTIFGFILVRSVKREVQQREEIEKLAEHLQVANEKLKVLDKMKSEFVSIASHQLRSPLTSIRGYASMLVEGSYGKLSAKAQEIAERIAESAKYMAVSVEDYLNVSRIEAGNMKYELSDFNLKDTAEKIVDELRPVAIKKGLVLVFRSDCNGSCLVNADIGKTRQVIMNLLDNSMKYTPKGTVTVVAHDDLKKKKMYITIQDTGVGMSPQTQTEVFEKFVRAKNANNVNVTGTGLGLFVAKKMITDMKGKVTAESEGEGKGSTFTIELPLIPGAPSAR